MSPLSLCANPTEWVAISVINDTKLRTRQEIWEKRIVSTLGASAFIHSVADKGNSRKPLFTLSDAYALGPVLLRADSSPEKSFRPAILLHVWMDIHSKSLRRLLRSCSRVAGCRQSTLSAIWRIEATRPFKSPAICGDFRSALGRTRTCDLLIRSWTESMSASVAYIHETPLPSQILAFCRG